MPGAQNSLQPRRLASEELDSQSAHMPAEILGSYTFDSVMCSGVLSDYVSVTSRRSRDMRSTDAERRQSVAYQQQAASTEVQVEVILDDVATDKQLHLDFHNIKGEVVINPNGPGVLPRIFPRKKSEKKSYTRKIMQGISGSCHPGEVLALMGPSGSGKTSVLSVLGGRTASAVVMEGTVHYNHETMTKKIKKRIGYVLQDDLLYAALTAYDTLFYAAMLRLPSDMSKAEKKERTDAVIRTLGLNSCRDTVVGGGMLTGFFRGISGGERKRVSIGVELLINPSAIFLDEPTSGLDATSAFHLLTLLQQLAQGGRAIVMTIHQPGSRLYMQLDKLLLLSEGCTMYYGQANDAAKWFGELGYQLPLGINQADFYLDIASGDVNTHKIAGEEVRLHCIACAERFLKQHPEGYSSKTEVSKALLGTELWFKAGDQKFTVSEGSKASNDSDENGDKDHSASKGAGADVEKGETVGDNEAIEKDAYGASWLLQYQTLLQRSLKTRRFEAMSIQDITMIIIVAIFAGLFWLQSGQTDTLFGAQNANGLLFFLMMVASTRAMTQALFVFPPEFRLIVKERESGMYKVSAYYFARLTSDFPIDCTLPAIFMVIVYMMAGLQYTAGQFFSTFAAIILFTLTAQSFGLFIGATVPVLKTATVLTSATNLLMVVVAGFFVTNIHSWIAWLKYLSFIFYGYSLLLKIQYSNRSLWNCGFSLVKKHGEAPPGSCTFIPAGKDVQRSLRLQRNPNETPWEAAALIGLFLVMRFAVYLALRIKTKSKVR